MKSMPMPDATIARPAKKGKIHWNFAGRLNLSSIAPPIIINAPAKRIPIKYFCGKSDKKSESESKKTENKKPVVKKTVTKKTKDTKKSVKPVKKIKKVGKK